MSEKLGFTDAVATVLRKYAVFKGTASRSEYWYFVLFLILVSISAALLDSWLMPSAGASPGSLLTGDLSQRLNPVSQIAALMLTLPTLGVTARRFHDGGHSARWLYLLMFPLGYGVLALVGTIFVLISGEPFTFEILLPVLFLILPMALTMLAVGVVFFAFSLQPTRSFFDGNKYAEPYVPKWFDGIDGTTS